MAEFITNMYEEVLPSQTIRRETAKIFEHRLATDSVIKVFDSSPYLYCLSYKGYQAFPRSLLHHRDKTRLFLLKAARASRVFLPGESKQGLAGDAPAVDGSCDIQERRPIMPAASVGRHYWPPVSKQLDIQAGPFQDSPGPYFSWYSFPSLALLKDATNSIGNEVGVQELALAIGISPRLLTSFIHAPKNHYRTFEIGKRGGGKRCIKAPRVFLKTVQYWLLDYVLYSLPVHKQCHSYQRKKSILTNALPHVRKKYVANIDIENFFGSVSTKSISNILSENGFEKRTSNIVARLVTESNCLPQGVPTSPLLSNSYLYKFDNFASGFCDNLGVSYSRYSDDITMSGNNKNKIGQVIRALRKELRRYGLKLNEPKTRIASRGGQQRVTGVVVNESAAPPRKLRRKVRAMFHNASLNLGEYSSKLPQLKGYLSYLSSFPSLSSSDQIKKYDALIQNMRS